MADNKGTLAAINTFVGIWILIAPFVFGVSGSSMWNAVVVGLVIAALGGYNWYQDTQGNPISTGSAAINALAGLWLIAAPFIFGAGSTMMWNNVIFGLAVLVIGGYNAFAE